MTSGTMAKTPSRTVPSRARAHNFLVIISLTTVFLFGGTIVGWGALSSMLQSEGYYSYVCELPDPAQPCRKQLQALNSAFTAASTFLTLTSYLNGWLVDNVGPKTVTGIAGCLSCLGLLGIGLTKVTAWSNHAEAAIFLVTMALAGFGGAMTIKIGWLAPFMVPSCFTLLMAMNSSMFDAGTMIYPLLKVFYDLGVRFADLFWGYAMLGCICYSLLCIAWRMNEKELADLRAAAGGEDPEGPEQDRPLNQRGLLAQLMSFEFAAMFAYMVIMIPRSLMYLGTFSVINRKIAETEGTLSSLNMVNSITSFVLPFGLIAVPLIQLCMRRLGTMWTVQVTTLIGVVYNILQLVPSLYAQLVTVVMFTVWRAFLYSTISSFNGQIFGVKTMGRIQGLGFLVAGLANLLNGIRVDAAIHSGDFTILLVENLAMTIPFPFVFYLLQRQRAKQAPSPASSAGSEQPVPVSCREDFRPATGSPSAMMSMTDARFAEKISEEDTEEISTTASTGEP